MLADDLQPASLVLPRRRSAIVSGGLEMDRRAALAFVQAE
jgi:hypothetical protein